MARLTGGHLARFLVLSCSVAFALPSPQSLGSDLAILTHNDLYGNGSTRQASVLVLSTPHSRQSADTACLAFGESLWTVGNSSQDLSFLRYLDYNQTTTEAGIYWYGSDHGCRALGTDGALRSIPCDTQLPALCSNTAALSSKAYVDTTEKWQTSIASGKQTYVGYRDKLSFRFLGIRYAARPARFAYTKYEEPSGSANVSALEYGPMCVQSGCSASTCSEDCYFLNVWTPYLPNGASSPTKKKAVMVWIHGGGFTTGSGSDTTFDGGNLASRGDVVVVTINYRLSTLGFLALTNTTVRGNYGIGDQITALDWIRAHIDDFGGDKNRITVFGQSAGAASVRALLASPLAGGKFSGAIMQSNPNGAQYASMFSKYISIVEATQRTSTMMTELNCTQVDPAVQVACLQAQDPLKLVGKRNGSWTGTVAQNPVVDGTYLPNDGLSLGASARKFDVPIITGVMHDDGDPFSKFSSSANASEALAQQGFDPVGILDSSQFPTPKSANTTLDIFNLTSRVTTDAEFRCLAQSTASVGAQNGIFPLVYAYEFDRSYQISEWSPNPPTCEAPITPDHPEGDPSRPYFKCHSGDLYYVFGTIARQGRIPRDGNDVPFSQYITDTWTAFARTRDPNPDPLFLAARGFTNTSSVVEQTTPWEPVGGLTGPLRILDTVVSSRGFREIEQCNVLGYPLDYYYSH